MGSGGDGSACPEGVQALAERVRRARRLRLRLSAGLPPLPCTARCPPAIPAAPAPLRSSASWACWRGRTVSGCRRAPQRAATTCMTFSSWEEVRFSEPTGQGTARLGLRHGRARAPPPPLGPRPAAAAPPAGPPRRRQVALPYKCRVPCCPCSAGQCGLAVAFGLMRERVTNVLVLDENEVS